MKTKNLKMKGFTLIELLVVITIIGILATIVIVNLNSTRGRGQDAAIKEQMAQIRSIVAIYYADNFGYSAGPQASDPSAACITTTGAVNTSFNSTAFADTDFLRSAYGIYKNSATLPVCHLGVNTAAKSQSWVMYAKMRVNNTDWWCVDSSGASIQKVGTLTAAPSVVTSSSGDISCE